MPVIPLDVDDEVLYTIRKVYLAKDTSVTIQSRLDFWGTVFFNGSPIANIGAIPMATQAQAEAGVDNTTVMSPLRTKQAITVQALPAVVAGSGGGTSNFLRADGTFAVPVGGPATVPDGDKGDITVSGSGTIWLIDSLAIQNTNIAFGTIANSKLANVSTSTIKGRITAASGAPEDLTPIQAKTVLGLDQVNNTSDANAPVSTAQAAADALKADKTTIISTTAPLTGGGDLSANRTLNISTFTTAVKGAVPPPTIVNGYFLKDDGTWAAPAGGGGGVTDGDKGDITVSGSGATWTIDAGAVTNAKMANMVTGTFKANDAGISGPPKDLGSGAATALLDTFLTTNKGLVPPPMSLAGKFLKDDGTWAVASDTTKVAKTGDDMTGSLSVRKDASDSITLKTAAGVTKGTLGLNTGNCALEGVGALDFYVSGNFIAEASTTDLTMVVPINLSGNPTTSSQAANKGYVDTNFTPKNQTINAQTGTSYGPALTDNAKIVTMNNAGAITVTVPVNATTAFPVGCSIDFIQLGAGKITFAPDSGVTLTGTPTLVTRAQYSAATLIKIATNSWVLVGDLA